MMEDIQPSADIQPEEPSPETHMVGHGLRSKSVSQVFSTQGSVSHLSVAEYADLEKDREELTRIRNIDAIIFGKYRIGVW